MRNSTVFDQENKLSSVNDQSNNMILLSVYKSSAKQDIRRCHASCSVKKDKIREEGANLMEMNYSLCHISSFIKEHLSFLKQPHQASQWIPFMHTRLFPAIHVKVLIHILSMWLQHRRYLFLCEMHFYVLNAVSFLSHIKKSGDAISLVCTSHFLKNSQFVSYLI